jgi:hypothetical protein
MSGGLSVPFTIGTFLTEGKEKFIYGLLAVAAFVYASYSVWKREREARIVLENQKKPKLTWEFIDSSPRHRIVDVLGNKITSVIYIRNISRSHIEKIEIFCIDASATKTGHGHLFLRPRVPAERIRLSDDESKPINVVVFNTNSQEFECLLSYRTAESDSLQGNEFMMMIQIVGVGVTPGEEFVPSIKLKATFGIKDGNFYISYEDFHDATKS